MESLDIDLQTASSNNVQETNSDLQKTAEAKEHAPARINVNATSQFITVINHSKGLLSEGQSRTYTQLTSNLNTYLKDPQSLNDLNADTDSSELGHYRKLTAQVINRDPRLQEKVAQDLSDSKQMVRSRDASGVLEGNMKNLPESLSEGTAAGRNLSKFICQSVVNLTDYENMGAGLQRDLAIRQVYAPNQELSLRQKNATADALSASIAYVKSNQPQVLATLEEEQVVEKTPPGTTTPQIMTRYLRQALEEFPEDSTYLDIFKQNRGRNSASASESAPDEISEDTAKRIRDVIMKAAITARKGNLIPSSQNDPKASQTQVSKTAQTVESKADNTEVDASKLSISELSARAAKLQQQFREERQRLISEGKLPDPAAPQASSGAQLSAPKSEAGESAESESEARADFNKIKEQISRARELYEQSSLSNEKKPQRTDSTSYLSPDDVKKFVKDEMSSMKNEVTRALREIIEENSRQSNTKDQTAKTPSYSANQWGYSVKGSYSAEYENIFKPLTKAASASVSSVSSDDMTDLSAENTRDKVMAGLKNTPAENSASADTEPKNAAANAQSRIENTDAEASKEEIVQGKNAQTSADIETLADDEEISSSKNTADAEKAQINSSKTLAYTKTEALVSEEQNAAYKADEAIADDEENSDDADALDTKSETNLSGAKAFNNTEPAAAEDIESSVMESEEDAAKLKTQSEDTVVVNTDAQSQSANDKSFSAASKETLTQTNNQALSKAQSELLKSETTVYAADEVTDEDLENLSLGDDTDDFETESDRQEKIFAKDSQAAKNPAISSEKLQNVSSSAATDAVEGSEITDETEEPDAASSKEPALSSDDEMSADDNAQLKSLNQSSSDLRQSVLSAEDDAVKSDTTDSQKALKTDNAVSVQAQKLLDSETALKEPPAQNDAKMQSYAALSTDEYESEEKTDAADKNTASKEESAQNLKQKSAEAQSLTAKNQTEELTAADEPSEDDTLEKTDKASLKGTYAKTDSAAVELQSDDSSETSDAEKTGDTEKARVYAQKQTDAAEDTSSEDAASKEAADTIEEDAVKNAELKLEDEVVSQIKAGTPTDEFAAAHQKIAQEELSSGDKASNNLSKAQSELLKSETVLSNETASDDILDAPAENYDAKKTAAAFLDTSLSDTNETKSNQAVSNSAAPNDSVANAASDETVNTDSDTKEAVPQNQTQTDTQSVSAESQIVIQNQTANDSASFELNQAVPQQMPDSDDQSLSPNNPKAFHTAASDSALNISAEATQAKDSSSVNSSALKPEIEAAVHLKQSMEDKAKPDAAAADGSFTNAEDDYSLDDYDPFADTKNTINSDLKSAQMSRPSVLGGSTVAGASVNAAPSQSQNLGTRILEGTIPSAELDDSIVPHDVDSEGKDISLITRNDEESVDEITIQRRPDGTPGAAAITSGSEEPLPAQSVVANTDAVKEKTGFFSKIASIFGKKSAQIKPEAAIDNTSRIDNSQPASQSFTPKGSPLDSMMYALKTQTANAALPQAVRDEAKKFIEALENPIDDLPSVSNWLNFTSGPMSPSSSQALALHQWAFFLLSIRFSQIGKSVDRFLKRNVDLMEDKFDSTLNDITKSISKDDQGKITGLIEETFDQVLRLQTPQKEGLPALFQYIPLPPGYDGGREGSFSARPVVEEDGKKSWHLNFVFDIKNLGPVEIKAVAKLPELKLSVVTSTFDGLQKVQQSLPALRKQLQELGITTTSSTARLGKVHIKDAATAHVTRGVKRSDGSNFSVDI